MEGLNHIQKQLNETKQPEALQLMDDVEGGFALIEQSVRSVLADINDMEVAGSSNQQGLRNHRAGRYRTRRATIRGSARNFAIHTDSTIQEVEM